MKDCLTLLWEYEEDIQNMFDLDTDKKMQQRFWLDILYCREKGWADKTIRRKLIQRYNISLVTDEGARLLDYINWAVGLVKKDAFESGEGELRGFTCEHPAMRPFCVGKESCYWLKARNINYAGILEDIVGHLQDEPWGGNLIRVMKLLLYLHDERGLKHEEPVIIDYRRMSESTGVPISSCCASTKRLGSLGHLREIKGEAGEGSRKANSYILLCLLERRHQNRKTGSAENGTTKTIFKASILYTV